MLRPLTSAKASAPRHGSGPDLLGMLAFFMNAMPPAVCPSFTLGTSDVRRRGG
jgi:hypothetical protein